MHDAAPSGLIMHSGGERRERATQCHDIGSQCGHDTATDCNRQRKIRRKEGEMEDKRERKGGGEGEVEQGNTQKWSETDRESSKLRKRTSEGRWNTERGGEKEIEGNGKDVQIRTGTDRASSKQRIEGERK